MRQTNYPTWALLLTLPLRFFRSATVPWALLLWLSGCATVENTGVKTLTAAEQIQLRALLNAGQDALGAGRPGTTAEDGGSAVHFEAGASEFFYQALAIQPENPAAQRGLEQILEQYLARAIDAADAGDFSSSYSLLNQARSIDPGHPSIEPGQAYITLLDDAEIRSLVVTGLSPSALSRSIDSLVLEVKSSAATCRFRIVAPSEFQTRSLYKALREGFVRNKLGTRIRASTTISKPKRLERICTP